MDDFFGSLGAEPPAAAPAPAAPASTAAADSAELTQLKRELMSTEKDFLQNYKRAVDAYATPLKAGTHDASPILDAREVSRLLSETDKVLRRHQNLDTDLTLEGKGMSFGAVAGRCAAIVNEPYIKYIMNYGRARIHHQFYGARPMYQTFLKSAERMTDGASMTDFLALPLERISSYSQVLKRGLEVAGGAHSEIEAAIEALRPAADVCAEAQIEAEQMDRVARVWGALQTSGTKMLLKRHTKGLPENWTLIKPGRKVVKVGTLKEHSEKQQKVKERRFFMFNDLFIKASMVPDKTNPGKLFLEFRGMMPMNDKITVRKMKPGPSSDLAYVVVLSHPDSHPDGDWYICFRSPDERTEWLEQLQKSMKEHRSKLARKQQSMRDLKSSARANGDDAKRSPSSSPPAGSGSDDPFASAGSGDPFAAEGAGDDPFGNSAGAPAAAAAVQEVGDLMGMGSSRSLTGDSGVGDLLVDFALPTAAADPFAAQDSLTAVSDPFAPSSGASADPFASPGGASADPYASSSQVDFERTASAQKQFGGAGGGSVDLDDLLGGDIGGGGGGLLGAAPSGGGDGERPRGFTDLGTMVGLPKKDEAAHVMQGAGMTNLMDPFASSGASGAGGGGGGGMMSKVMNIGGGAALAGDWGVDASAAAPGMGAMGGGGGMGGGGMGGGGMGGGNMTGGGNPMGGGGGMMQGAATGMQGMSLCGGNGAATGGQQQQQPKKDNGAAFGGLNW